MNKKRVCTFQGHEGTSPQYICTFSDCEFEMRWVCSDCLLQQLHNHGQKRQDHIMKQQQFIEFIIKQKEQYKTNRELQNIQELLKELEQLIQSTIILKTQVKNQIKLFQTFDIEHLINIARADYLLLDNQQLYFIIHLNNIKYDKKITNEQLLCIKQYNQEINRLIDMSNKYEQQLLQQNLIDKSKKEQYQKQAQQNSNYILNNNKIQVQESKEYDLKSFLQQKNQKGQAFQPSEVKIFEMQSQQNYQNYFEYKSNISISFSQISSDEQYLAIVGFDKKIQVFDLKTKQNVLFYNSQNQVNLCKFTLDSTQLLCTDDEGYLQQFDINKLKVINSNKIHDNLVSDLLFINNHEIITCSADKSIQIRNISSNQQINLCKNAHNDFIYGIDYDFQKQIIFSCSKDSTIKLFYKSSGKLVLEKLIVNQSDIKQIQVIPHDDILLSSSDTEIILWQIEYKKKQLIPVKVLQELVQNFKSVLQYTCIVLICENQVKLLDNNLNLMKKIQHDVRDIDSNLFLLFQLIS